MVQAERIAVVQVQLRMSAAERETLKEAYADTYPVHRLPWNRWLVTQLLEAVGAEP